ncbi:hypothetical protein D187_006787 [Cystobacter fuscus DSM 2262]|uniref:Uncharacterized protein n=1 Tax=Cystobacter fuscus (strain ATCC 25194 / DSM 2262 / NBRC 100088 / M29) TaxID=1242864 RepID=S9QKN5_CYSF2|nr:hypothetical protein D187_006787 [Cystobacter fuscus DSM 2262]
MHPDQQFPVEREPFLFAVDQAGFGHVRLSVHGRRTRPLYPKGAPESAS